MSFCRGDLGVCSLWGLYRGPGIVCIRISDRRSVPPAVLTGTVTKGTSFGSVPQGSSQVQTLRALLLRGTSVLH